MSNTLHQNHGTALARADKFYRARTRHFRAQMERLFSSEHPMTQARESCEAQKLTYEDVMNGISVLYSEQVPKDALIFGDREFLRDLAWGQDAQTDNRYRKQMWPS